jgi:hypothetical protein
MSGVKLVAILMVVLGIVGLAYGRVSFTREEHSATLGPFSFTARERQTVVIPVWVAVAGIIGGSLVFMTRKTGMRT